MDGSDSPDGALAGLRVLDLSRILAGPSCTQLLGDFGADVIKIEKPGAGDDTRSWGPPYLVGKDGQDLEESAYYVAANRNKRSVAVDLATSEGQGIIRNLLRHSDVLVENFKVGSLVRYGLAYDDLKAEFPRLVYCSITGFGQTGPYAHIPGYDFVAQGMGGIMSITGAPDGEPMKVGVGIADQMCGMYACAAILAALRARDRTGLGQHIDIGLLDTQVAWLANAGTNYLASGTTPRRLGNEHPNIAPYKAFEAADGFVVLAVGNDEQFRRWSVFADAEELSRRREFATNRTRLANRPALYAEIAPIMRRRTVREWVEGLSAAGVPCGPVHDIAQVFADPQVRHRGMRTEVPCDYTESGSVSVIGNPIKMSGTPVTYRYPPPRLGAHTAEVLSTLAGLGETDLAHLRTHGTIEFPEAEGSDAASRARNGA